MGLKIGDRVRLKKDFDFGIDFRVGANLDFLEEDRIYTVKFLGLDEEPFAVSFEESDYYFDKRAFDIVIPSYEMGKKYAVSDCERELKDKHFCLETYNQRYVVAYLKNALYPFIIVTGSTEKEFLRGEIYETGEVRFAREIPPYKAFTSFNENWIGQKIISNLSKQEFEILGETMNDKVCCRRGIFCYEYTFEELLSKFLWENGSKVGKISDY